MSDAPLSGAAEASLEAIRTQGYAVLERFIDQAQVDAVRAELSPYLDQTRMGRNDFEGFRSERVYALLAKSPLVIGSLIEHPTILGLVEALLGERYWLSAALAINVHPGETAQALHIDDGAGGHALPRPRRPLGVSTIWALDDFTAENGATRVIPGSHLWDGARQPLPSDTIPVEMPRGSVLVFAGNLYHCGGANVSSAPRLAITPQYCVAWLRQIENLILAVPPDVAKTLSPTLQGLIGYSVIDPGFMGHVNGLHPKRLLDAGYRGRKHRSDLPAS